jgi:protein-tyrosine-phosphatase/DNA-binding HxlR family transcriptional regulator
MNLNELDLIEKARRHAALGDPARLAVVEELMRSDRSPSDLGALLGVESNLLAHHLDVLESADLIRRVQSGGDRRRRYVQLVPDALESLMSTASTNVRRRRALFVCTRNSARSQIAAGVWRHLDLGPAESAGTHPATEVHPGAVAAAERAGINIGRARPRNLQSISRLPSLVITVCDQAHEEADAREDWLHWSIADPVPVETRAAFDAAVQEITERIVRFTAHDTGAQL